MNIIFSGGARMVSGSLHVIHADDRRWFVDCGLFQGGRRDMYTRNAQLPIQAENVAGVFLTHAHVDHSGRLPRLVKQGFTGPIYAAQATIDLCRLLLFDSAFVLHSQTASLNKKRERRGLLPLPDLYSESDVEQTLRQMVPVKWNQTITPSAKLEVTFFCAGHILGASSIILRENNKVAPTTIVFSGDLGRKDEWIMPNPVVPENTDIIVVESTYGDREHRPYSYAKSKLCDNLNSTINAGGRIIVPAFSVGRTQRMLYELNSFIEDGAIPKVPIYLDSPLSIKASELFLEYSNKQSEEISGRIDSNKLNCFNVVSAEDSRHLVTKKGPHIVITASGMCEAGRILYHLKENLPDPLSRVVFCGFCAENTLGRLLIDKHESVKILGKYLQVNAAIDYFDTFSAHADRNELTGWIDKQESASTVFVVHGEEKQSFSLAEKLECECKKEIIVPFQGEKFILSGKNVNSC
ncbi:MBL fold metallo-hydrolase [bacterium]|nr:MBL fold metallo-hydrolase [bacterium]